MRFYSLSYQPLGRHTRRDLYRSRNSLRRSLQTHPYHCTGARDAQPRGRGSALCRHRAARSLRSSTRRKRGTRHDGSCLSRRLPSLPLTQTKLPIPQASSYLLSTIPVFTIRGQYSASGGWLVRSIFLLLLFSTH